MPRLTSLVGILTPAPQINGSPIVSTVDIHRLLVVKDRDKLVIVA